MPTLYQHPMSTASRFVRLILAEYGFQVELVRGAALGEAAGIPRHQSGGNPACLCR